jgi:acyl-CoA synthetase (AMP-forming)/AMP-acid ligase II
MTNTATQERNLVAIAIAHAERIPDALAYTYLVDGENQQVSITFGELDRRARAFAATLQKISKPGDRALLLYPSSLEFVVAFLGCLYAGVISAPSTVPHLKRSTPRLKLMMDDAKARIACTTQPVYEKINVLLADNPEFNDIQWIISETVPESAAVEWEKPDFQPDDIAFLQYTSGSTSSPKGVMITSFNLLRTVEDIVIGADFDDQSTLVSWLPIFHDMGLVYGLLTPLYVGRPCYLMSPVSFLEKPIRWLQAISKNHATHTAAPNFAYDVCTRKVSEEEKSTLDLSALKFVVNAAEPVRLETMQEFAAAFKKSGFRYESFTPSYGLAEATVKVSSKKMNQTPSYCSLDINEIERNRISFVADQHPNSYKVVGCGWSGIDADIKIVNFETGKPCASNEIGEIWIHSDSVAQGYWQNPEASKETFQARITGYNGGPFLRTGDMGFIHEGELYIAGRIKDMIIIQGKNYYPQDIELTVERCHNAIRPSCGAAFAITDGETEKLIIVQEVKREYRKSGDLPEVANKVRMAVAKNHGLRVNAISLIMPSTIEKTTSGKIQRSATRESFMQKNLEILYEWHAPDNSPREKTQ